MKPCSRLFSELENVQKIAKQISVVTWVLVDGELMGLAILFLILLAVVFPMDRSSANTTSPGDGERSKQEKNKFIEPRAV